MSEPLRILLVDDHVLFRKGLAALMAVRKDLVVAGEASDGLEAADMARERAPDVVLMDVHMPRCSGLDAIPLVKQARPEARIVMLTVSSEDRDLFTAIRFGADGYLLKDLEPRQLFDMLDGLRRGEAAIAPALAGRILNEFRQLQRGGAQSGSGDGEIHDGLTPREIDVLRLVSQGSTNKGIAGVLSITENTVKIHLRNILEKLHLQNRTQATAYAIQHGLVGDPHMGE